MPVVPRDPQLGGMGISYPIENFVGGGRGGGGSVEQSTWPCKGRVQEGHVLPPVRSFQKNGDIF